MESRFSEPAHNDQAVRAWRNVRVREWTPEGWAKFLRILTPRQLVFQMHTWWLLGEDAPELQPEFDEACGEARAILRRERLGLAAR